MGDRFETFLRRALRSAFTRWARATPRRAGREGAGRRVTFVLMTAWGMGGTIRTVFNLAGHLASRGYEVEILSVGRGRDKPFFGTFPDGVTVTTLEDKREKARPARENPLRRWLRENPSVLMHPDERAMRGFNLLVDLQLVRALRRRSGFLVTTRPGLNLIAAQLQPPGLVLIGQEHMHLRNHPVGVRRAMKRQYPKLAALAVLTEQDRERYTRHVSGRVPVVRIPNAVRDMGGARADIAARTALAAGRFARQKGYDRLIPVWGRIAPDHPDWRLRILGEGPQQPRLERLVRENGLEGKVSIERPARDMGAEMSKASMFVLSSRWEGLPLVLLEAMSVGMAVVSFDCPTGPADIIDDHVNGLLVQPRTLDALEAGLREMIESEELRRRCAAAATETVRGYTVDAIGRRWEEVLAEAWQRAAPPLLSAAPPGPRAALASERRSS